MILNVKPNFIHSSNNMLRYNYVSLEVSFKVTLPHILHLLQDTFCHACHHTVCTDSETDRDTDIQYIHLQMQI